MKLVSKSVTGKRKENQDRVITAMLSDSTGIAILCDGMGGENAGAEAGELAVNSLFERIKSGYREDFDENQIKNLLISAVYAANAIVYSAASEDISKEGMGTTCVIVLAKDKKLHIVNVGDSRAYSFKDNTLSQLTTDHTVVKLLYDQGKIAAEEMINHPQRNLITRAVGAAAAVDADYFEIELEGDTVILLCSDGLSSYCKHEDIEKLIDGTNIDESSDKLIQLALDSDSHDNITVALISEL